MLTVYETDTEEIRSRDVNHCQLPCDVKTTIYLKRLKLPLATLCHGPYRRSACSPDTCSCHNVMEILSSTIGTLNVIWEGDFFYENRQLPSFL